MAKSQNPTDEEIQELANELEYVFSNILVKDEKTGVYIVNEDELKNSHYTEEEQTVLLDCIDQQKKSGVLSCRF